MQSPRLEMCQLDPAKQTACVATTPASGPRCLRCWRMATAALASWFNNCGRTGGRSLRISEKALLASMLSPFLEGRKERRREAHSTLEFYEYEAKNIHTYTPFSSPGTRLLLTGNFLHIIAEVPVLFSVFFGELSRTLMPLILEKRFCTLNMNFLEKRFCTLNVMHIHHSFPVSLLENDLHWRIGWESLSFVFHRPV